VMIKRRDAPSRLRSCDACKGPYSLPHDRLCAHCRTAARQALPGHEDEGGRAVGYRIVTTPPYGRERIRMGRA
jgi:hypothetical protein